MHCTKCGTYLFDEHQFCINCGTPRPVPPPTKKGTRWIPVLILTLMFALGCVVYYFSLEYPPVDETPALSVQFGSLYFDESQYEGDPELIVPDTVDGQNVTIVGTYCFRACDSLTSITLPHTVEQINSFAFFDCENLETVRLSDGITTIGDSVFFSCGSLDTVHIPGSVEYIAPNAFKNCNRLKHIYFDGTPEDWEHICYAEIGPSTQIHYVSST